MKTIVDLVILFLWMGVFVYFLGRYFVFRRVRSLAIGLMSLGWVMVGLGDRFVHCHPYVAGTMKVLAIVNGIFCWWAINHVEK